MGLEPMMAPFISSTALLASSGDAKHTKPKPLLTSLRSFMTRADVMVPCLENSSRRRASVTVSSRFLTYRLTPWNLDMRSWRRASYCSRSSRMRSAFFWARPTNRRRTNGFSSLASSSPAAPSVLASAASPSGAAAASSDLSPSSALVFSPSLSSDDLEDAAKVESWSAMLSEPSSLMATPFRASTQALAWAASSKFTKPNFLLVPSGLRMTLADCTVPWAPTTAASFSSSHSSGRFFR
mmetsp:Transcript_79734/g.193178  ORF Transcript_79734/g.193178 Transcript_79734/m.193178 type:complete len:239 (-) Transcript_79734:659-1375(-)